MNNVHWTYAYFLYRPVYTLKLSHRARQQRTQNMSIYYFTAIFPITTWYFGVCKCIKHGINQCRPRQIYERSSRSQRYISSIDEIIRTNGFWSCYLRKAERSIEVRLLPEHSFTIRFIMELCSRIKPCSSTIGFNQWQQKLLLRYQGPG